MEKSLTCYYLSAGRKCINKPEFMSEFKNKTFYVCKLHYYNLKSKGHHPARLKDEEKNLLLQKKLKLITELNEKHQKVTIFKKNLILTSGHIINSLNTISLQHLSILKSNLQTITNFTTQLKSQNPISKDQQIEIENLEVFIPESCEELLYADLTDQLKRDLKIKELAKSSKNEEYAQDEYLMESIKSIGELNEQLMLENERLKNDNEELQSNYNDLNLQFLDSQSIIVHLKSKISESLNSNSREKNINLEEKENELNFYKQKAIEKQSMINELRLSYENKISELNTEKNDSFYKINNLEDRIKELLIKNVEHGKEITKHKNTIKKLENEIYKKDQIINENKEEMDEIQQKLNSSQSQSNLKSFPNIRTEPYEDLSIQTKKKGETSRIEFNTNQPRKSELRPGSKTPGARIRKNSINPFTPKGSDASKNSIFKKK